MGLEEAAKELGIKGHGMELETDASAAKSYASRRGAGRIRHVEVRWLWLQKAVADGRFKLVKIAGGDNPADVLTKYKSLVEAQGLLRSVSVEVVGRPLPGEPEERRDLSEIGWIRLGRRIRWADAEE